MNTIMIAALSGGNSLVNALIWLVGMGLIFWLLWWLLDYLKLPEPFAKVGRVLLALVAVIILIKIIIQITGSPF